MRVSIVGARRCPLSAHKVFTVGALECFSLAPHKSVFVPAQAYPLSAHKIARCWRISLHTSVHCWCVSVSTVGAQMSVVGARKCSPCWHTSCVSRKPLSVFTAAAQECSSLAHHRIQCLPTQVFIVGEQARSPSARNSFPCRS